MKFKWNFILFFFHIKHKFKSKTSFRKKQCFDLNLKHCFSQEMKLLSHDMYNYSASDYINYFLLTKNDFKFNIYIKIKIGYGKNLLVFFFCWINYGKLLKKILVSFLFFLYY
ncbi:hypothetical protein CPARA_1gp017 (nucleomorph) [Cryptomonas paramecium]|uniref:Uncharacterized protein n=1 Tax=Cryptomonas paramaecium TaxID=2898 RepID=F2HH79_9CRYP|nr:hypothetical protein CPARA_1gp017 [Cryptomonas paramecium]AEA38675.1 hypothetical protein CPARA_1gp017 [Cryptomonas paramecium]